MASQSVNLLRTPNTTKYRYYYLNSTHIGANEGEEYKTTLNLNDNNNAVFNSQFTNTLPRNFKHVMHNKILYHVSERALHSYE